MSLHLEPIDANIMAKTECPDDFSGFIRVEATGSEAVSGKGDEVVAYLPCFDASFSPLNDFYYRLVQAGYYRLSSRDYSLNDIGEHIMDYMSWGNCGPVGTS